MNVRARSTRIPLVSTQGSRLLTRVSFMTLIVALTAGSAGCGCSDSTSEPTSVVVIDTLDGVEPTADVDLFVWDSGGENLIQWAKLNGATEVQLERPLVEGQIIRCDVIAASGTAAWSAEVECRGDEQRIQLHLEPSSIAFYRTDMKQRVELRRRAGSKGRQMQAFVDACGSGEFVSFLSLGERLEQVRTQSIPIGEYRVHFDEEGAPIVKIAVRDGAWTYVFR